MDSRIAVKALEFLRESILKILLVTDGRTTDMLEALLNEKMIVHVIRQEQMNEESSGDPFYIRESLLVSEKSGFLVSHNFSLVLSKHVPPSLFEEISNRQEGIGKSIGTMGLRTFRKVLDFGAKNEEEAVDLFQKPIELRFPELRGQVPYKKYSIYFGPEPGIQMLEYFNPNVIGYGAKNRQ
ncbi:4-hydroxybenzoate synthetase [Cohnella terricola]|uniref:4-hydroxybenzoate synthetase n=2 Tax=Cohnella terricola TaxID=1289167 RepID=A0A559JDT1_9BACL|nr:4-hydroxybenzoate synthetase [Cohnella terricola]